MPLLLSSFLFLLLAILLLVYLVFPFLRILFRQCFSPLRLLPGPPSPSFFIGNLAEMHDQENNNFIHNWEKQFGSTFVYRGFIGGCRLMTTDPIAIAHILGNAYDYPKPDFVRDSLASMVAGHDGILTVEGEDHRRQVCSFKLAFQVYSLTAPQRKILVSFTRPYASPVKSSLSPDSCLFFCTRQVPYSYISRLSHTSLFYVPSILTRTYLPIAS